MSQETEAELIQRAAYQAYEQKKTNPLKVGDLVANPCDRYAYVLMKINEDGTGLVARHDSKLNKDVTEVFPLQSLFDVELASAIAIRLKAVNTLTGDPLN